MTLVGPGLCLFNEPPSASDTVVRGPHRSLGGAGSGRLPTVGCVLVLRCFLTKEVWEKEREQSPLLLETEPGAGVHEGQRELCMWGAFYPPEQGPLKTFGWGMRLPPMALWPME